MGTPRVRRGVNTRLRASCALTCLRAGRLGQAPAGGLEWLFYRALAILGLREQVLRSAGTLWFPKQAREREAVQKAVPEDGDRLHAASIWRSGFLLKSLRRLRFRFEGFKVDPLLQVIPFKVE